VPLGFVPDELMGDDPQPSRRGWSRPAGACPSELAFDHLPLAHGMPIAGDRREAARGITRSFLSA
jgi:hypothetical protein